MAEAFSAVSGGGTLIDYSVMPVGAPAGDRQIIRCEKCQRSALAKGRTAVHLERVVQTPSGKTVRTVVLACESAVPKPAPAALKQTGLPWCPKEFL